MKEIVKPAFIRWLSDLMKADNIIAIDEIRYMEKMCREFSISQLDIEKALGISLAEASDLIKKHCREKTRQKVIDKLKNLSLSDGSCAREEALLILALSQCLNPDTERYCRVISFESPHIDFKDSQVLFIEPNEDEMINGIISDNHKTIVNDMRIGGFDFIYIPYIAQKCRNTNNELLFKIFKYLAPSLSNQETRRVLDELGQMTTRYFLNVILKEKLDISIPIKRPCIMLKIGNSYVNGNKMSDFLLVELKSKVIESLRSLIDTFLEFQRCTTITINNYTVVGGDFIYTGFYKTIFDLVTYRKGARCQLIIEPYNRKERIKIKGVEEFVLDMGLAGAAFYEFLIVKSLSSEKGVRLAGISEATRTKILSDFGKIYHQYAGNHSQVPDITDFKTRNPLLTKIRKAILNCKTLSEKHTFLPNTETSKMFIGIDSHHVFKKINDEIILLFDNLKE